MSITTPYGIDTYIQKLQSYLTANLWIGKVYTAYGKAYINNKDGNKIPEIIDESSTQTGQYLDVLFNSAKDATSFFVVDEIQKCKNKTSLITVGVDLIFQVQLNKIYPLLTHRCTEEVVWDVRECVKKYPQFTINEIRTGEKAYEGFNLDKKVLTESNMHPYFTFKFVTDLNYFNNQ